MLNNVIKCLTMIRVLPSFHDFVSFLLFFLLYYKLWNRGRTTIDGPLRDANTARFTLEKAARVFEGRYLTDRYPAEHPAIQDGQEQQQQVCGSFQVCLLSPSSFPLQLARTPLSSSSLCFWHHVLCPLALRDVFLLLQDLELKTKYSTSVIT